MKKKILITTLIIAGVLVAGPIRSVQGQTVFPTEMVTASQDALLARAEKSNRVFKKLEIREVKIVSYFHRRKIDQATIEKDFIRYQFNTETEELIEKTVRWRSDLPAQLPPVIAQGQAESMVQGVVQSCKLYFISPESNVYPIKPTPKNPCWIVRSIDGKRMIITIIDAITSEKLGYAIPPPVEGFAFHCDDEPGWADWRDNADGWFELMGYSTGRRTCPCDADVQSFIQSDSIVMFYELSHGGSWSFHQGCPLSCTDVTAAEIETWIDAYASMPFTFLGSCDGMCDVSNNRLSYEFRKGFDDDAVTVGYCGMSTPACDDCWDYSVDWQDVLFLWMYAGHTVGYAFNKANLAYPDCAGTNNCMRIAGDTVLTVVPVVTRSLCGNVYDGFKGPLSLESRDHYIRCDITVPAGQTLTVDPSVDLVFLNDSKVTSYGTLNANGATGQIRFVSELDSGKGMEFTGQIRITGGGQIKIYE
ncbi:MAG: hypothetical protein ACYTEL_24250 [Planctomycetota bacterium]|jgi:hypothetical protein